jgi:3D (Asp-Asp-Asp) domain-containing protein
MRIFILTLLSIFIPISLAPSTTPYTNYSVEDVKIQVKPIKMIQVKRIDWQWVDWGMFTITAYCANCSACDTTDRTADCTRADWRKDIIAMDRVVPFNTKILIDGMPTTWTVHDRGGKIKGRKIDVLMSSHWRARKWGVQKTRIWSWQPVEILVDIPEE